MEITDQSTLEEIVNKTNFNLICIMIYCGLLTVFYIIFCINKYKLRKQIDNSFYENFIKEKKTSVRLNDLNEIITIIKADLETQMQNKEVTLMNLSNAITELKEQREKAITPLGDKNKAPEKLFLYPIVTYNFGFTNYDIYEYMLTYPEFKLLNCNDIAHCDLFPNDFNLISCSLEEFKKLKRKAYGCIYKRYKRKNEVPTYFNEKD